MKYFGKTSKGISGRITKAISREIVDLISKGISGERHGWISEGILREICGKVEEKMSEQFSKSSLLNFWIKFLEITEGSPTYSDYLHT